MRNETFRMALKSLGAPNQPFRGFLCYQGLEAGFVSLRCREALADRLSASASRAVSRRPSLSSILSTSSPPLWNPGFA
jgi:hypothetical protein